MHTHLLTLHGRMYFNKLTEYVGMPRQGRYLKRLAAKT